MEKKDKAVSWAISLRESQWAFINALAEKWGVSRSLTLSLIIRIFTWQNRGRYEEALHSYMASGVKGREDGAHEE